MFFTQITMEAAEDPEFLAAMKRARIKGALVGVESVTPEGLKAVFKNFNDAGDALVAKLQKFREGGVHVLGSFIFGLPTDKTDTFMATADLAQKAGVTFAQFVMLTPLPGTLDFEKWEKEEVDGPTVDGMPLTRYWLIPSDKRPKIYTPHPRAVARRDPRRHAAGVGPLLRLRAHLAALERGQVGEGAAGVRAAVEAVPADVREHRHRHRQRARGSGRPSAPGCWRGWRDGCSWRRRCPTWPSRRGWATCAPPVAPARAAPRRRALRGCSVVGVGVSKSTGPQSR